MSTGYLCVCGISSAHSISAAVRSHLNDSPPGSHCALTALTWTQASLTVAAGLVAILFRKTGSRAPTTSLMVQRSRYAALQLLPIIMARVPAELDKHLEEDVLFTMRSHCTLALAVLVRSPKPCRYLAWRKRGANLQLCMCAGDERILRLQGSSRHRGGCLPRTHPPALLPDCGRCAALPLATELLQWIPSRPPCNIRCGCQGGILFTGQHVAQVWQTTLPSLPARST